MFTAGVMDARSPTGDDFGVERLVKLVMQHLEERVSSAESLRRITLSLLTHHQARLIDDATLLLLHWHPE
jgi:serine phosphatase RsbU (regulator of sigma subunit)